MLYISYLWTNYIATVSLNLLISLTYFFPSPTPPLWQPPASSLYL